METDIAFGAAPIWRPAPDARTTTRLGHYLGWLERERGLRFDGFGDLHAWSIADIEAFWASLWDYFEVRASAPYERVLDTHEMPGARWFEGARLNYAEHIVGGRFPSDAPAVVAISQTREPLELTYGELTEQVARARAGLAALGVGPGDRVVGYLPNIPETLVAFLACASLGATWAACAPEFGDRAVVDRFAQIDPTVLLSVGGYMYGDKYVDRRQQTAAIAAALPTARIVVEVPYGRDPIDPATLPDGVRLVGWAELIAHTAPLEFAQVGFDHPLCILFSSGTTGLPKAIVHGHGGILLEHLKNLALQWDLGPGDRLMWFTTTAWMMWNALVSVLLTGASIVMLDGNPAYPEVVSQWKLAAQLKATLLGLSPNYLAACRKAELDLTAIEGLALTRVCTAGSPLPPDTARWLVESLGVELINGSGGTDVCSGMVQGNPLLPVWANAISGPCLGTAVYAFDADGNRVVGELGEMVITEPMPSMPVGFWNDPGGERYLGTYFDRYPGAWRQGDWIVFEPNGACNVTGRSDATLNRGGVRLGTGEFYRVVDELAAVATSLVVHLDDPDGGAGELILFVVPSDGYAVDDALKAELRALLKAELSPRHVPDSIVGVDDVPLNLTGKKLELPVKKILQGVAPEAVASRDALLNPPALDAYVAYARTRLEETPG
ncbi:MAG TPA: acetoacetate--CoA ligase [Ilumatobacter sp.]|nr:acetoacetate--CoA ligase [Ilumatobacter sp.]